MAAHEHPFTVVAQLEHALSTLSYAETPPRIGTLNRDDDVRDIIRRHAEAQHCLAELLIECGRHALGKGHWAQYCNALIRWSIRCLFEEDPVPAMTTDDAMESREEVLFNVAMVALQAPRPSRLFDTLADLLRIELKTYRIAARLVDGPNASIREQARQLLMEDPTICEEEIGILASKAVMMFREDFAPPAAA